MLDDGLEFKKEIRTINISLVQGFVFFPPFTPALSSKRECGSPLKLIRI